MKNRIENLTEFIETLKKEDILLFVKNDKLGVKIGGENKLSQKLSNTIQSNKNELINHLNKENRLKNNRKKTSSDYGLPTSVNNSDLLSFKELPIHKNEIVDISLLSPLQEGMLFHSLYDNDLTYIVQFEYDLLGKIAIDSFKKAWAHLISVHSILRTAFFGTSLAVPIQTVYSTIDVPIVELDFSDLKDEELEKALESYQESDKTRGFSLDNAPLFRITLIHLGDEKYRMLFTNHHILMDGWSFSVLTKEFTEYYISLESKANVPNYPIDNYTNHVKNIFKQNLEDGKTYWKDYLLELSEPTYLPFLQDESKRNKTFSNKEYDLRLSKELSINLKKYSKSNRLTVNTIFQGLWSYLLSNYTGVSNVAFGAVISGRDSEIEDIENKVGLYINTIPVCNKIDNNLSVCDWLLKLQDEHTVSREEFNYVPLNVIESQSQVEGSLFDTLLIYESFPEAEIPESVEAESTLFKIENSINRESTNYTLTMLVFETDSNISVRFMYNEDLLSDDIIVKIGDHLKEVLTSLVNDSNHISDLNYLTTGESIQLLDEFNSGSQSYPEGETVLDLFNSRVVSQPSSLALVYGDDSLTYQELSDRSDEFCNYLLSAGLTPGSLVPICMDRSIDMMVGLLGILKSGCAYIPIDPLYPQDRIAYILSDTGGSIVVSTTNYAGLFEGESLDLGVVCMDDLIELPSFSGVDKALVSVPSDLAYVIYTSGTTGLPKGVMVSHSNLTSFLYGMDDVYPLDSEDRLCLKTNYTFDVSVHELFGWIKSGSSLVILKPGIERDMESFIETIGVNEITHLNLVPSLFKVFLESVTDLNRTSLLGLKFLYLAGEALPVSTVHRYKELNLPARLENIYGPTELTIYSTYYSTSLLDESSQSVSIGRPLGSTSAYVLGEDLELLPVGVSGELCLSGPQLTQGYLNRPDLTSEKFVSHPFKEGVQMYRTGDLVRWNLEGDIEYIGRKDSQVKIRGYRIELGEIESLLGQITGVIECVVIAFGEESSKRLIGYVQLDSGIEKDSIVSFLKDKLPEYMVPQHFIELDEFPLTNSGKIDRKRLPEPSEEHYNRETYIAAETEIEEQLVLIWQELLGIEKIGIEDNFLNLGGHSLLAIRLVSQIKLKFNITINIRDVFNNPTIKEISKIVANGEVFDIPPIVKLEKTDQIPLSYSQERLWFLDKLYGTRAYQIPWAVRIKGTLRIEILEKSIKLLLDRHQSLCTVIKEKDGVGYQSVKVSDDFRIKISDLSKNQIVSEIIEKEINIPFDLYSDYMLRVTVVPENTDSHVLILVFHHIASDGWSIPIFVKELTNYYDSLLKEEELILPSLPIQYTDYSAWQRSYLSGEILEEKLNYWVENLEGAPSLNLPTDYPRPTVQSTKGASYGFRINKELVDQLNELSNSNGVTLFMTLLGVYKILLSNYTGQTDISVGTPVANREQIEVSNLIGFFINTIVLRDSFSTDIRFIDFLEKIKQTCLSGYSHQDVPFEKILNELTDSRDLSRSPLFQTMFILQNNDQVSDVKLGESRMEMLSISDSISKYDLLLEVTEDVSGLSIEIEYATSLFKEETIIRMASSFRRLLESVVQNPKKSIKSIEMLSDQDRIQLLDEFNSGSQSYPEGDTVLDLFNSRVVSQPSSLALVYGDDSLTYQELSDRSDEFCNYLLSAGLTPGSLVPICMDRSIDMMVGLLGILKSGCAYIPIDPLYPQDRIAYILSDTGGSIVVSTTNYAGLFEGESLDLGVVCMDDLIELPSFSGVDKALVSVPSDLAYVIYTSGTTGLPKGVMVSHSNLTSFLYGMDDVYPLDSEDRLCLKTNYTFDVSVHELFGWIKSGSSLVILKPGIERDMESFIETIGVNEITHLNLVPSLFKVFLESVTDSNRTSLLGLKFLYLAGEALPVSTVHRYKELNLPARLENIYGPTELTIYSTYYSTSLLDESSQSVSIGRPLGSTSAYVLGEDLELLPVGVSGELCLSGPQLTQGYLNRPDLTSEKFVSHPFKEGVQMYRTGDLVRWNLEGDIEYIGRKDSQVKIRGYRIELGEIESLLGQITGVIECVVIAFGEESSKRLIGYVQLDSGIEKDSIVSFLKDKLPEYMVPQHFIELDEFPLTNSGKIDRKRLPEPSEEHYNRETYIAAETEIEEQLVLIWQELLGIEKIGVEDNFFSLGGDSIKAIQLVSRSNRAGIFYKVKDIFKYQHIRGISSHLEESVPVIEESGVLSGIVGLHPIQKQFFEKQYEASHHYNQSMLLKLSKTIDKKLLTEAVQELVSHHDVLRFSYEFEKGYKYPIQSYGLEDLLVVDHEVSDVSELEEVCSYYQSDLDPLQGEMFRFVLIRTPSSETANRLFITVHHLSIDGVSWRILLEDLSSLLSQIESGDDLILPAKQTSYRQWVSKLEFHSNSSIIESEYLYWKRVLSGYKPLEVDHDCADITTYAESSTHTVTLDKENTYQLLHDLHDAYGTEINDILLSALSMSFSKYTSADRLVIGLEGHGREELFDEVDITRTLGWFTSLFPVSLGLKNTEEIGLLISDTKDMLRAIPHKGLSYGMLRYQSEKEEIRSGLSTDYEDVVFNYLGNFGDSQEKENEESIIGFAGESKGQDIGGANKIPNKIGINIIEIGGMLHMYWTYDQKRYKASTIEQLAQDYINSLEVVIAHCKDKISKKEGVGKMKWRVGDKVLISENQLKMMRVPKSQGVMGAIRIPVERKKDVESLFRKYLHYKPSLCLKLTKEDEKIYQHQVSSNDVEIEFRELNLNFNEENSFDTIHGHFWEKPYDFFNGELIRVHIYNDSNKGGYCHIFIGISHALTDLYSNVLIYKEIESFIYQNKIPNTAKENNLDFGLWQNNFLKSEKMLKSRKFWMESLKRSIGVNNVKTLDYSQVQKNISQKLILTGEDFQNLKEIAKNLNVSLFGLFIAFHQYLLSYLPTESVVFQNVLVNGRDEHLDYFNVNEFVGTMNNFLPMPLVKNSGNDNFEDYIKDVYHNFLEIYSHQIIPFEVIKSDFYKDSGVNLDECPSTIINFQKNNFDYNKSSESTIKESLSSSEINLEMICKVWNNAIEININVNKQYFTDSINLDYSIQKMADLNLIKT